LIILHSIRNQHSTQHLPSHRSIFQFKTPWLHTDRSFDAHTVLYQQKTRY